MKKSFNYLILLLFSMILIPFSSAAQNRADYSQYLQNKIDNRNSHIFKSKPSKVPPVNDDICNAIELIINGPAIIGDNREATVQVGEPYDPACAFQSDPLDSTIWYYFVTDTIPSTYTVTTDLNILTNDDTQLAVYSSTGGCSGPFSLIACNEDADPGNFNFLSTVSFFRNTPGDTIWIQVDGWGGTTGTFEIQLLSNPVPQFDAAIDSSSITATGLAGYNLVPFSQNDPTSFFLDVKNVGQSTITNIAVNGSINPGASNVSGNTSSIPAFGSEIINTGTVPVLNAGSSYTADFNVAISENDGDPLNNSYTSNFTSGMLSDSVFALENSPSVALISSVWNGISSPSYGNKFIFTSPDTITSVTVGLGANASGLTFELSIDSFDQSTNSLSSNLWTSNVLSMPTTPGFYTYSTNLPVDAGTYLISISGSDPILDMGIQNSSFRPNTSFYTFGAPLYFPAENVTNPLVWIIRANMNTVANQPASLGLFNLNSPSSGTRVISSIGDPTPVLIDWSASNTNSPGTVTYEWLVDVQGGSFVNPLFRIPSDNNGTDTTLTLTLGSIDSLLNSIGIFSGDSVDVIWTMRASLGASNLLADNGPFDIRLIRGFVTGFSMENFDNYVKMYPNPNRGKLIIEDSERIINSVRITDLMGREVKSYFNIKHIAEYRLNELNSGLYLVNFDTDKGNIIRKIIIE